MKLEINPDEEFDVIVKCFSSVLEMIKRRNAIGYVVIHNNDGTCYKVGTNETDGLWLCKYTEDDDEVK